MSKSKPIPPAVATSAAMIYRSQHQMPIVSAHSRAMLAAALAEDSTQWRCADCGRLAGPDEPCGCNG